MHNHNEKNNNWMMWAMMLCCALPLLLILVFGVSGKALGSPTWVIFGGVAVMIIIHFFMMSRSHKQSDEKPTGENDKNHSGHGCCH